MNSDYIPSRDTDFQAWLTNFCTVLSAHLVDFGMVPADLGTLGDDQTAFSAKLADHLSKQAAAVTATTGKNNARTAVVADVRPIVRRISNHPAMTDELRSEFGLNIPGSGAVPSEVGIEAPELAVDSYPGLVVVHFGTNPLNEQLNTKPAWAKGCNIYRKKAGEDEFTFISYETSSPFNDSVTGPAADYTYIARYRGTKSTDLGRESNILVVAAGSLMAA